MDVIDRVHIEPIGLQAPTKVGFPVSASTSSRSSFSTLQPPHHLAAIRCDPTSSVPSGTATSTERSSANLIRTLANNRPTDGHGLIRLSLESRRAGLSICGSCILSDLRKRRSCAVSNSLKIFAATMDASAPARPSWAEIEEATRSGKDLVPTCSA
jgi:hypothetical protein